MSYFLTILKFLPELISLIKLLTKKINQGIDEAQIKASLKHFDGALDRALKTKDTSALEGVFRGKK